MVINTEKQEATFFHGNTYLGKISVSEPIVQGTLLRIALGTGFAVSPG